MVYFFSFNVKNKSFFRRSGNQPCRYAVAVVLFAPHIFFDCESSLPLICDAPGLFPFTPLWSIGGGLPSPSPVLEVVCLLFFYTGLDFSFPSPTLAQTVSREGKKHIYLDKQAARFKKRQHQVRELQISKQREKGTTTACYWSSCARINGLASKKWLGTKKNSYFMENF